MAEEEVLQEAAPPPSKKKSGGFNIIYLVVLLIFIIGAAAMTFILVSGKISSANEQTQRAIETNRLLSEGRTEGIVEPISDCSGKDQEMVSLSEEPIIVMMADGDHYLSVEIALCILRDPDNPDQFESKRPMVLHLINDYLSTYPKSYFFEDTTTAKAAGSEGDTDLDAMFGGVEQEASSKQFLLKRDSIRVELRNNLIQRGAKFVKEVYFPSFLIQ